MVQAPLLLFSCGDFSFSTIFIFPTTSVLQTMQGSECLFEAVEQQDLDTVQILLYQFSADELDLNTPNSQGLTPLDIAIMTNNTPIAKLLLKAGGKEGPHCECHSTCVANFTLSFILEMDQMFRCDFLSSFTLMAHTGVRCPRHTCSGRRFLYCIVSTSCLYSASHFKRDADSCVFVQACACVSTPGTRVCTLTQKENSEHFTASRRPHA